MCAVLAAAAAVVITVDTLRIKNTFPIKDKIWSTKKSFPIVLKRGHLSIMGKFVLTCPLFRGPTVYIYIHDECLRDLCVKLRFALYHSVP